ncbi:LysR family transcriptional regulator [Acidimangrovimonas sediminis]|uniref:LysR family transcriptional regulator n=1 Tax=Acidimangrovimonas sediminis TaxID=2056283 RepID=UPI000C80BE93|nr:LysR family transcriptional regulator [Acidimangrovimonas sediminis]
MKIAPSNRQVRAFLAVAHHLQFTRAAAELNMSQPAVTVQITQLEEQLEVKLFDRSKRAVFLTSAGRALLPLMERLEADFGAIVAASEDLGTGRRGTVRVAALPSVAATLLLQALGRFRADNPGVTIEIFDVVGEEILRLVKDDAVDFGIGLPLTPDRGLTVQRFVRDRICAYVPAGHPLDDGRAALPLSDCAAHPLILTKRNSSVRVLFDRAIDAEDQEIEVAMEVNYMSSALGAVRAGLGIAILPASAREAGCATGLVHRPILSAALDREVGIIRRADRSLQPAAALLVAALRDAAHDSALFQALDKTPDRAPDQPLDAPG